jgi:periplasmic protein CpxP/Spy
MKHVFLTASLALALSGTLALGQSAPSATPDATPHKGYYRHNHTRDPQRAAERIGQRLGLSTDQTTKLQTIFTDQQQKMATLRANTSLSPDQRREQFQSLHENMKTQLATVLTPEQIQQLHSMRHGHDHHQPQQNGTTNPQNAG